MPCIQVRQGDGVISIFEMDGCGRPLVGAAHKLVLTQISEITWTDTVDAGDQVRERNFAGRRAYTNSGLDIMSWIQVALTSTGIIPALDSLLLGSATKVNGSDVVGYGRLDITNNNVAIEVLIQLDAESCTATSSTEPPVFGMLFGNVNHWAPSNGGNFNGTNLIKPQYTGKGYKNPLLASLGTGNDALPTELDHWTGIWDPAEWYTTYLFDADDVRTDLTNGFADLLAAADCDLQTVLAVA
jgi:hypothetical protein